MPNNTGVFFEEYAHPEGKNAQVLNGHIFAIIHLNAYLTTLELLHLEDNHFKIVKKHVDGSVLAIRNYMDDYDARRGSFYSRRHITVKPPEHYAHRIHFRGLLWLGNVTQDDAFTKKAREWCLQRKDCESQWKSGQRVLPYKSKIDMSGWTK